MRVGLIGCGKVGQINAAALRGIAEAELTAVCLYVLAATMRKTRFRLLARLCRVGLVAHKASTKGFRGSRYISSSLPKLFLAQYENGCPDS